MQNTNLSKDNTMQNTNLSKDKVARKVYKIPDFKVINVGMQRVICGSETEKVDETNGEW